MNLETYGLIPENPVKLNSEKAAMAYLNSLVTKNESHHILFHKLMSFDFNLFDGKEKTLENATEVYQICRNDETIISVFINIYNDECVWIPPASFDFEYDSICICNKEMTEQSEAEYTMVQVDKKYVSLIRTNWVVEDFEKYYPESIEHILFRNWGVNYKTNHFPHDLWTSYLKENTICLSDMNEEQLEIHNKCLTEIIVNEDNMKEGFN